MLSLRGMCQKLSKASYCLPSTIVQSSVFGSLSTFAHCQGLQLRRHNAHVTERPCRGVTDKERYLLRLLHSYRYEQREYGDIKGVDTRLLLSTLQKCWKSEKLCTAIRDNSLHSSPREATQATLLSKGDTALRWAGPSPGVAAADFLTVWALRLNRRCPTAATRCRTGSP